MKRMILVLLLAGCAEPRTSGKPPSLGGCPLYPPDHILNTRVDNLPVDPKSEDYLDRIGRTKGLHPDFGPSKTQGIPYMLVDSRTQPMVPVRFLYPAEGDPGPYPIPLHAPIEGGPDHPGDRHVLALDVATCKLYEMYKGYPREDGSWLANIGVIFNLRSYDLRPAGWTSADAAGLAVLPGLIRYQEILDGEINHAIRFTAPKTRKEYVWPARHRASVIVDPLYPPMGQRFRLRKDYNISGFSKTTQIILTAMKKYGIILSDNGGPWFFQAAPDPGWWNIAQISKEMRRVYGSNFEAVDVSSLKIDENSGKARTE